MVAPSTRVDIRWDLLGDLGLPAETPVIGASPMGPFVPLFVHRLRCVFHLYNLRVDMFQELATPPSTHVRPVR